MVATERLGQPVYGRRAQAEVPDRVQVPEAGVGVGGSVLVVQGDSVQARAVAQDPVEAQGRVVAVRAAGPELGAEGVVAAAAAEEEEKQSPAVGWPRPP